MRVATSCLLISCLLGPLVLPRAMAVEIADLQEQLEDNLRARRPVEFAFIARVVYMVEHDQLPLSLVRSIFQWSRGKRPYPFIYFRHALIIQAARRGIVIETVTPPGLPPVRIPRS